jgi:hypothetical protein
MLTLTDSPKRLQVVFITLGFMAVAGIAVFVTGCWLLGKCYRIDSTITAMGICLEGSNPQMVTTVPKGTQRVYLCGRIEGTSPRPGWLELFHNEDVIYGEHFEYQPGQFYHPILIPNDASGLYVVEIGYAREVLARTEFSVDSQ